MLVGLTVTFHVPPELLLPPLLVVARERRVLGAGMPEATVDEHRDPFLGEEDVGPAPGHTRQRGIHPEPVTSPMESATEQHLRLRVAAALTTHPAAHTGERRTRL